MTRTTNAVILSLGCLLLLTATFAQEPAPVAAGPQLVEFHPQVELRPPSRRGSMHAFARACLSGSLALVGSHGQTVYHHDGQEPSGPATLQLGDGDFVAVSGGSGTIAAGQTTTNIAITWSAVSNGTYRVQFNPVLNTTNWTDLAGDVTATGSTASKTDTMTTTNRFYRVRVLP